MVNNDRQELEAYLIAKCITVIENHCWAKYDSNRPKLNLAISEADRRLEVLQAIFQKATQATAEPAKPAKGKHSLYITTTGWPRCKFCDGRAKKVELWVLGLKTLH